MDDKTPPQENVTDESGDVLFMYISEIEKLRQKLKRAYVRRDHYAQQYYRTVSELDETKFQLGLAKNKIQQLTSLLLRQPTKSEQNPYPPEYNGRISPDSGAVSMSPGLEGSEGHANLDDSVDDDIKATPPPSDVGVSVQRGRMNSDSTNQSEEGIDKPQVPPKRVAFRDQLPIPPHSTSTQYDHTPHPTQPVFQRSYTMGGNEIQSAFVQPQSNRIQRTQTVGYDRVLPPQSHQYPPGYRGHQYNPNNHHHPPHSQQPPPPPPRHVATSYSLSAEHGRLPRVHRGVVGYENVLPHHPHPAAMMNMMSGLPQPHMHTQPLMNEMPISNNMRTSFRLYSAFSARQQQSQRTNGINRGQPSVGESQRWWLYNGLPERDLLELMSQLSDAKCNVKKLEISGSNLGNSSLMDRFCKELRKNRSIEYLSLPMNGIARESLQILLDTVSSCKNIRELNLSSNAIGGDSVDIVIHFLRTAMVESIILSGNEIEHHSYLFKETMAPSSMHDEVMRRGMPSHPAMKQSHTTSNTHYGSDH